MSDDFKKFYLEVLSPQFMALGALTNGTTDGSLLALMQQAIVAQAVQWFKDHPNDPTPRGGF